LGKLGSGLEKAIKTVKCNWRSRPKFGHTLSEHGAKRPIQQLIDRARAKGPQGQWLDNDKAAEFLSQFEGKLSGPTTVPLPEGLGQVVLPDGTTVKATSATLVPSATGFQSAYPVR